MSARALEAAMALSLVLVFGLAAASLAAPPDEERIPGRVQAVGDVVEVRFQPESTTDTATDETDETGEETDPGPAVDVLVGAGYDKSASQWPAVAVGDARRWTCSGVAVGPRLVLTARHCLPAERVLQGDHVSRPEVISKVLSAVTFQDPRIDVAILRLASSLPGPYATLSRLREVPPGLVMVGYGARSADGRRGFGTRLDQSASISQWGCTPYRAGLYGCLIGLEFVVPNEVGVDTCDGDSGGPVYAEEDGLRLIGLTSRPVANARTRCGDGGIYTRIDSLQPDLDALIRTLDAATPQGE